MNKKILLNIMTVVLVFFFGGCTSNSSMGAVNETTSAVEFIAPLETSHAGEEKETQCTEELEEITSPGTEPSETEESVNPAYTEKTPAQSSQDYPKTEQASSDVQATKNNADEIEADEPQMTPLDTKPSEKMWEMDEEEI